MTETDLERLRYPIGRFDPSPTVLPDDRARMLDELTALPGQMREVVDGLPDEQLDTPYRPDGWTVRQVVHHVPDSHLNSYVRFRWTLTEEQPMIKTYFEERWAELEDARSAPIELSLNLLEAVHARWLVLLRAMTPQEWSRTLMHPDWDAPLSLDTFLQLYAWHGKHHLAHVRGLREREGW